MVFNFIGETHSVRKRQLKFITEKLQERGFNNCDVTIEPLWNGSGFMSNVVRVIVSQNGETFRMIAKIAPESRSFLNMTNCFKNEHTVYTELLPKFRELQKNANVPERDWFGYAKCFGTLMETPNEVILLEDLKKSYGVQNKFETLSTECVQIVLKKLAMFHSLSYVLKKQEPKKFDEIASRLGNIDDEPSILLQYNQHLQTLEDNVLQHLNKEEYKDVFNGTIKNINKLASELKEKEKSTKSYTVIRHGDVWTPNIMLSLEDETLPKCMLVDYQMALESSPVFDVMKFLFNCVETEQKIEHYTEFIDYYYKELEKSLSNHDLKAKDIYPRDQLNADMKLYTKIVLAVSVIIAHLLFKDVEDADKVRIAMATSTPDDVSHMMLQTTADSEVLFTKRIEGLARTVIELKLL